jgi:hypothetical protein
MTPPDPADDPAQDPATPIGTESVAIHAVQFVGTNVEMTVWVDAAPAEAETRLDARLRAKLGLYALTRTGDQDGRTRFSVMASPLDRLFHAIGPRVPLTVIKHASVTLDLSETNLTRQAQGLVRDAPEPAGAPAGDGGETWRPWDAGKLLGTLLRRPSLLDHGEVRVAGVTVPRGDFPQAILPTLTEHVDAHGGVAVVLPTDVRRALAG